MNCLTFGLIIAALGADAHDKVNPVQKVTKLLSDLQKQIMDEGKEEAAEYDKYACFCKEQVDDKTYAINKASERELVLEGLITSKEGIKEGLDEEVAEANIDIGTIEGEQETAKEARATELGTYQTLNGQLENAIKALKEAIETLEASKSGMVDMHEPKAALTSTVVQNSLQLAEDMHLIKHEKVLALLGSAPHAYSYHSNEIKSTLEALLKDFKQQDVKGDEEERAAVQAHEMKMGAMNNEITALQKAVSEKSLASSKLAEEINEHEAEKSDSVADRTADTNFRSDLTTKCEQKAQDWDQRSRTRSAELAAIAKAMEMLKGDVTKMYPSTGLSLTARKARVGHWQWVSDAAPAPASKVDDDADMDDDDDEDVNFAQTVEIVRSGRSWEKPARKKVIGYLEKEAKRIGSDALTTVLLKIRQAPGPFSKIKSMIYDMINRLEKQATDETNQKQWCDTEMASATGDRDDAQANVEDLQAKKEENLAKIEQLKEEIIELAQQIADLTKALNDATVLREEESINNNKTIVESTAGYAAVTNAINFLNSFYDPTAIQQNPVHQGFLQAPGYQVFKAANEDRSGLTVDDRAPAGFSGTYGGKTQESASIIGLLSVIQSDFDRTITETTTAESTSQSTFNSYKRDTDRSIRQKTRSKDNKETTKSNTEADVVQNDVDLGTQGEMLQNALDQLEKLQPVCVDTGMEWKERAARRKQEVESLKEALKILQDTDFGFLQH